MLGGLNTLLSNIGVQFETAILIVFLLGGLIFFARDWKTGIIMLFFVFSSLFVWLYEDGYYYKKVLIIAFMALAALSLTLFFTIQSSKESGYV